MNAAGPAQGAQASAGGMVWPAEALWETVVPVLPGFTVEVLREVDSTSSELMRRARAGQTEPVLLVAEHQTAGRGRLGRPWAGGPGASLMFSLGLPLAPADWSGLSLAVGVCLAESLHAEVRIKWPNDLWLQGRKLAGILIETAGAGPAMAPRYVVVGVGINIFAQPAQGLSTPPAWMRELSPHAQAPGVLAQLALPLVQGLQAFERGGFGVFRDRFLARDALAGRTVGLSDGLQGLAQGVGPDGALLVHTADGMKQVTSSEVSVRPLGDGD